MLTKMLIRTAAIVGVLVFAGCAETAHLYNLSSGEVLTATYQNAGTGHGQITIRTPSGQVLTGEYSTISGMSYSTGVGAAFASGTGGYAWATAQGFSFNQPGQQFGHAIAAGNGLIIDIVYAVDPWSGHGSGVGKDNRGGRYRVLF